ncbi:MAG: MarR family transcriptional regulator [Kibdelosporangium sp.]
MKPLGYWLKQIDSHLEDNFGRLLETEGLTRRHWQILNALAAGARTVAELDDALAPFRTEETFRPLVDDLTARGWVTGCELTEAGRSAHRSIEAKVLTMRAKTTEGISAEEYRTLLDLLRRVATNVAAAR